MGSCVTDKFQRYECSIKGIERMKRFYENHDAKDYMAAVNRKAYQKRRPLQVTLREYSRLVDCFT